MTFLTSNWTCIYGAGCPGIEETPAPDRQLGCCTHGAYLSDEDDLAHVSNCIDQLDAGLWQLASVAEADGGPLWRDEDGWWRTKVVDGACIFQNRPDHPGGAGCAFHHLAIATDRPHHEVKPEICWQAPVRREDHETVTGHIYSMVREWQRRDWGGEETDVWWWCTDDEQAHVGTRPVYREMAGELEAIVGPKVFRWLRDELDERLGRTQLLPHPTVRRRSTD